MKVVLIELLDEMGLQWKMNLVCCVMLWMRSDGGGRYGKLRVVWWWGQVWEAACSVVVVKVKP